jgi:hypothetical protein
VARLIFGVGAMGRAVEHINEAIEIQPKAEKKQRETSRPGATVQRDLEDRGSALIQIELKVWAAISPEIRIEQLQGFDERYHAILDELYGSANLCVDRYQTLSRAHTKWRWTLILGTGLVAIVNLVSAHRWVQQSTKDLFPIAAAVLAVILAILANLESFSNSFEKAQGYRESRELFLDVAREFDRRWDVYVRSLGDSPEACVNAAELYRQIATRDRELRAKFKELTKTEAKAPKRTP